jgi:putative acetyltransferase
VVEREYPRLVEVWEASVRATHDFLTDSDVRSIKPLLTKELFDSVDLAAARDPNGAIIGFVGAAHRKIEMLFIHPEHRGSGVGSALLKHAVARHDADSVDVNEQNPQALGFYLRMGFRVIGRSERDGQGNPFPLLHMSLIPRESEPAEDP